MARLSTRNIVIGLSVGLVAFGMAWFARSTYRKWDRFVTEERICGGFQPVLNGLDDFLAANGSLPTNLTQLIPLHVAQLPAAPLADGIDYRVLPDGTNWQMTVRSRITGASRVFVRRSSDQFTAEEEGRAVAVFHRWRGFKE